MGLRLRQKSPSPPRSPPPPPQQQEQRRQQQQPSPPPTPQPQKSLRKARKNTHRSRSRSPSGLNSAIVLPSNIIPYGVLFQDDEPEDEGYSSPPSTPTDPPPHMHVVDGWRMVPERGLAMELMFGNMDADLIDEIIGVSSSDEMEIDEPATPSNTRTSTRIPHTRLSSSPSSEASSSSMNSRNRRYSENGFGGRVVDENYD